MILAGFVFLWFFKYNMQKISDLLVSGKFSESSTALKATVPTSY